MQENGGPEVWCVCKGPAAGPLASSGHVIVLRWAAVIIAQHIVEHHLPTIEGVVFRGRGGKEGCVGYVGTPPG